jgi:hypothetical protein
MSEQISPDASPRVRALDRYHRMSTIDTVREVKSSSELTATATSASLVRYSEV